MTQRPRSKRARYTVCMKQMHRGYVWINDLQNWMTNNPVSALILPDDLWYIVKALIGWPRVRHLAVVNADDVYPWDLDERQYGDY